MTSAFKWFCICWSHSVLFFFIKLEHKEQSYGDQSLSYAVRDRRGTLEPEQMNCSWPRWTFTGSSEVRRLCDRYYCDCCKRRKRRYMQNGRELPRSLRKNTEEEQTCLCLCQGKNNLILLLVDWRMLSIKTQRPETAPGRKAAAWTRSTLWMIFKVAVHSESKAQWLLTGSSQCVHRCGLQTAGSLRSPTNLINQLCDGATCRVIHKGKLTVQFKVRRGVRKRCMLSPLILLQAVDGIKREATKTRQDWDPTDAPSELRRT